MAKLTQEQIAFQLQHISLSLVLDASGLSSKDRITVMEQDGKIFYFGGA